MDLVAPDDPVQFVHPVSVYECVCVHACIDFYVRVHVCSQARALDCTESNWKQGSHHASRSQTSTNCCISCEFFFTVCNVAVATHPMLLCTAYTMYPGGLGTIIHNWIPIRTGIVIA
jgi:hypothetical protein